MHGSEVFVVLGTDRATRINESVILLIIGWIYAMALNLLQVCEIKAAAQQVFGLDAQIWLSGEHLSMGANNNIDLYIEAEVRGNIATKKRCFLDLLWDKLGAKSINITIRKSEQSFDRAYQTTKEQGVRL